MWARAYDIKSQHIELAPQDNPPRPNAEERKGMTGFQFRDIRPKAASEIADLGDASRLLGHTDKRITETVYRRVGEIVKPTR